MPRCQKCNGNGEYKRRWQKGDFSKNYKGEVTKLEWEMGFRHCLPCRQDDYEIPNT